MTIVELSEQARLRLIEAIASRLAGQRAHHQLIHVPADTVVQLDGRETKAPPKGIRGLWVTAGERSWEAASLGSWLNEQLTISMLISLSREANCCPSCLADMPRDKSPGLQRYDCAACGFEVAELVDKAAA